MTRKPADGTTPVETLEDMKDDLSETIDSLEALVNAYEELHGYYNEIVRDNLYKALEGAQLAYDNLRDDIEAMEEE